jgi:hypothetical protein
MSMPKTMRQMPEQSGRAGVARGEAACKPVSFEASGPPHEHPATGSAKPKAGAGPLLEAALTRENLQIAWRRVKANKGAAGVDGLDIEQTAELLRKVMIPKPDGSQHELGIPTVLDRLLPMPICAQPCAASARSACAYPASQRTAASRCLGVVLLCSNAMPWQSCWARASA